MMIEQPSASPSDATVLHTLRDGYWDRTDVIRLRDGSMRVRKVSKGGQAGPWSQVALRREIQYLGFLRGPVVDAFPRVLAAWDNGADVGYEMSYIDGAHDAGTIAQAGEVDQTKADRFQDMLGTVVFDLIHVPVPAAQSLGAHVRETLDYALATLEKESAFVHLIRAESIRVNRRPMAGARRAVERVCEASGPLSMLDAGPCVRLHGDCFMENILVPTVVAETRWPARLTMVDPVSVAGVYEGHPMFDLVKYESYATGELLALRSGKVDVDGFDQQSSDGYVYRVREDEPALRPFTQVDWRSRFRAAYLRKYLSVHLATYELLEGYFALVMAVCTSGVQRRARLLKATMAFNAAGGDSSGKVDARCRS